MRVSAQIKSDDPAWDDWRWQLRNRTREGVGDARAAALFPLRVTPYYAALGAGGNGADPIARQWLPDAGELEVGPGDAPDPFGERADAPAPGVVHRYPDRVVLLVTAACAVRCRFCTRRNTLATAGAGGGFDVSSAVEYLHRRGGVREVILSGGDPLLLGTAELHRIVAAVEGVPHVEVLRIGSRAPVALPMRIDDDLCRMLASHGPIWLNTHFNHPAELTPAAAAACRRLLRAGVPVSNQTVLLRGVNDDADTLVALCAGLQRMRVRPYYVFLRDPVAGTGHFAVPPAKARRLERALQRRLGGLALPRFVADRPGTPGKTPLRELPAAAGEGCG